VLLLLALHLGWISSSGPGAQQLPTAIEGGTAAVITATTGSPFGEPERATGRWLPFLRFGAALALTGIAFGVLSAASASLSLYGGELEVLRNVAGLVGIGLLLSGAIGSAMGWIGPMLYVVVAEYALSAVWTSPWVWPARPAQDLGAAICSVLVFAAGLATTAARGCRESPEIRLQTNEVILHPHAPICSSRMR
jgi:hypothetical protein